MVSVNFAEKQKKFCCKCADESISEGHQSALTDILLIIFSVFY